MILAGAAAALVGLAPSAQAATFATITGAPIVLDGSGSNLFSFVAASMPHDLAGKLALVTQSIGPSGYNGAFEEIYEGPTTTLDGVRLIHNGTSLLNGRFDAGVQGAGGVFTAHVTSYWSPFGAFSGGQLAVHLANASKASTLALGLAPAMQNGMATFATAAIPEPGAWVMMLAGAAALGGVLRRRTRAQAAAA